MLVVAVVYFVYTHFFGKNSGCDKHASRYSCSYVKNKATYDVYYWFNVNLNNSEDEKFIGSAVGLFSEKYSHVEKHRR